MTKLDKRNDPDWCMQVMASVFAVIWILLGLGGFQRPVNHGFIATSLAWLVVALRAGARWRRKQRAFEQQGRGPAQGDVA